MRLPVEVSARRWPRGLIALSLAGSLAACSMLGGGGSDRAGLVAAAALPANGPQADYPVLVGDPYEVAGQPYRPIDTMNYDEVGYLAEDPGAVGVTGSHHTLPVPSYAEITSLATGRTVLVRLERRGPMASNHVLALSPAALAQLDATVETPVRVRRVNPPEEQRTLLRAGQSAPLRMDTPMALVSVLRRRLPAVPGTVVTPAEVVVAAPASAPAPAPVAAAAPAAVATPAASGGFLVQAATFSTEERARLAAAALGGVVSPSGNFFRVRTGPFANRNAAEASLANVRAAGYSDARILTGG